MGTSDIRRKAELFFCSSLSGAVPGITFVPSKGGANASKEVKVEPPFVVVQALDPECVLADPPTWQIVATVTYVTHIGDADAPAHSAVVKEIYDALRQIPRGYCGEQQLMVHGIDITGTEDFADEEERSRGDVINLMIGCTG